MEENKSDQVPDGIGNTSGHENNPIRKKNTKSRLLWTWC
jgi:hypothetical protein